MWAIVDITSGNRKFTYARKGDEVKVLDRRKYPVLLCERGHEKFMATADQLQDGPLGLSEVKSPEQLALKQLRTELRKQLNKDAYIYQIIANRVYYDKVNKFPKHITKPDWMKIAQEVWDGSHMYAKDLIDINKANV